MNCGDCTAENCGRECPEDKDMEDSISMWLEIDCNGHRIYHNFEPVTRNQLSRYYKLQEATSELEAENTRLLEAVEWISTWLRLGYPDICKEVRARAFPPKLEMVEVKAWRCMTCNYLSSKNDYGDSHRICCKSPEIVELTGHIQRPIPAKAKRRAEISRANIINDTEYPQQTKFFREWEE